MGFYVRDLYLDSARFHRITLTDIITHDPLTNPPTVPETSPILAVAQLSPQIAEFAGAVKAGHVGQGAVHEFAGAIGSAVVSGYLYPDPDGNPGDIPPWLTPIVQRFADSLHEADLVAVRGTLEAAVKLADGVMERMQPQAQEIDLVRGALEGALKVLG